MKEQSFLAKWSARLAWTALVLLLASAVLGISAPLLPWNVRYWNDTWTGDRIISKIEAFRREHGRLPNSHNTEEMVPLGFEDALVDYRPEYEPVGRNAYQITYVEGLDGPNIVYSSITRQWSCDAC